MNVDFIYYLMIFFSGTFVGSFLNLVSDRIINGEPIFVGRSHCDYCKKPLGVKNLIPILSFLFQGGKCDSCHKKLSWFYPISEFLSGGILVFATYYSGILRSLSLRDLWDFIFLAILLSIFLILFLTDAKYCLIPDSLVYLAIILTVIFVAGGYTLDLISLHNKLEADPFGVYLLRTDFMDTQIRRVLISLAYTLGSSFIIAFFFFVLVWATKERGMGGGDIKLGLLIGLFNGFPNNFIAIFLGFLIGAVFSVGLIALGKKTLKDTVAFGPFLISGSLISLLYGQSILNWYINLF